MKGIRLSNGTVYVEHEGLTVRLSPTGECQISPVLYMVVEWDLRTEPPENWEYLSESQIRALDHGAYEKVLAVVADVHSVLQ